MAIVRTKHQKDPGAKLDWVFTWGAWLTAGETISTSEFIVDAGLTIESDSNTATSATIWLSGGRAGVTYKVTNRVTTSAGRIEDLSINIRVIQQVAGLFTKDPDALLDYSFDWSGWLGNGEEIDTSTFTSSLGIVIEDEESTPATATVWLSGGEAGLPYRVTNRITTTDGRIDERSYTIRVTEN